VNEAEWLASADPRVMLEFLGEDGTRSGCALVSERKLRLWVEACRCQVAGPKAWPNAMVTAAELERGAHFWCLGASWTEECPLALRAALLRDLVGNPWQPAPLRWEGGKLEVFAGCAQHGFQLSLTAYYDPCGWLTPAVLSLARAAYEQRLPDGFLDPECLAVLSDALEEAGCEEAAILEHLRSPGPHALGCFCVDLLLGKE
jgi:hypothetical protein